MKVVFKKKQNIDIYDVYIDGIKTKYNVRKGSFATDVYYLVYYGNQLKGRFESMQEVQEWMKVKLLDEYATLMLKDKM